MNFIEGVIDGGVFASDALRVALPGAGVNGRVTIGIRPEHIQVFSERRDGALEASVYVTELIGNETFVFLTVGTNRLIARAPADFRAEEESKVWLLIATGKTHFFDPDSGENLTQRRKDAK